MERGAWSEEHANARSRHRCKEMLQPPYVRAAGIHARRRHRCEEAAENAVGACISGLLPRYMQAHTCEHMLLCKLPASTMP